MRTLNKILGKLGFKYCPKCGEKKVWVYTHGFKNYEIWKCLRCDEFDEWEYERIKECMY